MAYYDTSWYVSATAYAAIPVWTASTATPPGTIRRQTAPALGSERCFIATQAGTQNTGTTEPAWVITRGGRSSIDGLVNWQECTGAAGINGDTVNCPTWAQAKAIGAPSIGAIIQRNSGASFQMCTTAGTLGASEPGFSNTPGVITAETSATTVWTCIGTSFFWSAPHARTTNALAASWGVAGNDFYLADNSAETSTAAINISLGSAAAPCRFFSVDHTAALPATPASLKPGATITSTLAASGPILIGNATGCGEYFFGINFVASGAFAGVLIVTGNGTGIAMRFESCTFSITGALATSFIAAGSSGASTGAHDFVNCTFGFSNASQYLQFGGGVINWRNTPNPCLTGTIPNPPMRLFAGNGMALLIEGVDLSAVGGSTLFTDSQGGGPIVLKNCKLHSGALTGGAISGEAGLVFDVVNCDTGTSVWRNERHTLEGDVVTLTTVFRTGGAVDGGTPISHQIGTSGFVKPYRPFNSLPLVIWNNVVGTLRTATLYGVVLGTTNLPFNDQFWFEVAYMGDTLTPSASFVSNGLATQLTTHTVVAVADAVSVWTGVSFPSAPFSLSLTFTAQQKGYVTIYPRAGSVPTFCLDPKPVLS